MFHKAKFYVYENEIFFFYNNKFFVSLSIFSFIVFNHFD